MPGDRVTRRRFLQGSAAAGLGLAGSFVFADERPMPMRALGSTGLKVSLAGLGCHPIGRGGLKEKETVAVVRRAHELGINYFDTAPSYGSGRSETRVGKALKPVRDQVLIATKTLARDKKGALKELDESLKRLQTDRVDIWQFHALAAKEHTDAILRKGGALEAAIEAKKAGKVRFIGITGHADPQVFVDALGRHVFDTLLIPLNCIDPHHRSFEEVALPVAKKANVGLIAMKVFCSGRLPPKIVGAEECLRYTYGLDMATCIVGADSVKQVELAAHIARNGKAMAAEERKKLRAATKPHSPKLEWYKRQT
ncbi:MAG: aldo/keto reductase [Planctomycetota bacterium]|jgi:aryl-alcohol dehydrogenase-like predicted oxidoreductase